MVIWLIWALKSNIHKTYTSYDFWRPLRPLWSYGHIIKRTISGKLSCPSIVIFVGVFSTVAVQGVSCVSGTSFSVSTWNKRYFVYLGHPWISINNVTGTMYNSIWISNVAHPGTFQRGPLNYSKYSWFYLIKSAVFGIVERSPLKRPWFNVSV